jgi:hypothetical protein
MILGRFRFEVPSQRLYKGSAETPLTPKVAAILSQLTKRPNELVSYDELLDEVWRGVHIQPEVLKVYIAEFCRACKTGYGAQIHRNCAWQGLSASPAGREGQDEERTVHLSDRPRSGIARLINHLRLAASGRRQLVFVTGEPGIGKTALFDSFFRRIGPRFDALVARGQCTPICASAEPFSPFLDALSNVWQGDERDKMSGIN